MNIDLFRVISVFIERLWDDEIVSLAQVKVCYFSLFVDIMIKAAFPVSYWKSNCQYSQTSQCLGVP